LTLLESPERAAVPSQARAGFVLEKKASEKLKEALMKTLKVNPLWIGSAAAAAFLVLILSWGLMPKVGRHHKLNLSLGRLSRDLDAAKAGTPSRADIKSWSRYGRDMIQAQRDIATFYSDNLKSLNRWFSDLPEAPDGYPPRDAFVARYQDEARSLEQRLSGNTFGTKVGGDSEVPMPGFHWEDLRIDRWEGIGRDDERAILRELQKRFRVRERVANAALSGDVRMMRLVDFRFFQPIHEKFREAADPPGSIPSSQWPGIPSDPAGSMTRQLQEPAGPITKLTFGFALELPYSEVAHVVHEVISPGAQVGVREGMLITIIGTHVTIRQQNQLKRYFEYESNNEEDRKAKQREILESNKPGSVLLTVTCQVVDGNVEKLRQLVSK
jgi:hypothetical protein